MHGAKVTGDELKSFYTARAAIEDDYARKLLNLARKPLGSSEAGTLRMSLDVLRGEVESMGKSHQNIAGQMKRELEEPLSAFTGGLKERRKIIQTGIEKLLKTKTQQTGTVNKARDRYEQDCLKIKGYLAQGHMVMGQEERKNKAKLEKTQIQMSATSNEYEAAVKILEETTGRWNREWKAACDKFQDLEEERIDYMKSSLWSFANIASTVCVSDDASCEKVRLSLEDCDVEKDITSFIREQGTGQEIPDPPKYINFCRGDINDNASEASDDGNYSVAQFQRTMNPAFRSSSPQPSTYESHHDPDSTLAQEIVHKDEQAVSASVSPATARQRNRPPSAQVPSDAQVSDQAPLEAQAQTQQQYSQSLYSDVPKVPHNEYPMEGMTQFCRMGPPSERSTIPSPTRPVSRDSQSEYSNPTSFSSFDPSSGNASPTKQYNGSNVSRASDDNNVAKKKSGFFQHHSPFRRKSKNDKDQPQQPGFLPSTRNTWAPPSSVMPSTRNIWVPPSQRNATADDASPTRQTPLRRESRGAAFGNNPPSLSPEPEPVDPRANFQLNIGNNVFDVASPDARNKPLPKKQPQEEFDPIAQALAELKGVTKQASVRMSADRYHELATPAPPGTPGVGDRGSTARPTPAALANRDLNAAQHGTPPPSYDQPVSRLGAPQPAFTSRQMQQTTERYTNQKRDLFNASSRQNTYDRGQSQSQVGSRPGTRNSPGHPSQDIVCATSPAPLRSTSPRPYLNDEQHQQSQQRPYRATSPNPYAQSGPAMGSGRPRAQSTSPVKPQPNYGGYNSQGNSPGHQPPRAISPNPAYNRQSTTVPRAVSPQPQFARTSMNGGSRPPSSRGSDHAGSMAIQLAPAGGDKGGYNATQRRPVGGNPRPTSQYHGGDGAYAANTMSGGGSQISTRDRSQSAAGRQYTKEGRPILHYARALYMYQAVIPEELSFAKGDVLAVLRLQDDGWWEAEVAGKMGRPGLVPSNYLAQC
ncbi:formin-binding protein [Elasticomyces elasticus]|nr:formin-binding protein [Elasticomyces elasticus]